MIDLTKEQKYIVLALVFILLSGILYGAYTRFCKPPAFEMFTAGSGGNALSELPQVRSKPLIIHISGAIKKEGVFRLPPGSRVLDAVNAAGGFLPGADISSVNLAEELKDGGKMIIPSKKPSDNIGPANSGSQGNCSININTAGEDELTKIPGVGKVTAQKIVEYRKKNGRFLAADDLKKIGGIGDKKLEKMREYIVVN